MEVLLSIKMKAMWKIFVLRRHFHVRRSLFLTQ